MGVYFITETMGNTEAHDVVPRKEDFRKELNISRKVTHKQFVRVKKIIRILINMNF